MSSTNSAEGGDGQVQLLIATLKNTAGQVNFAAVAQDMGIANASAAQKRVKRYLDKISPNVSLLAGSTLGAMGPTNAPATPKAGRKNTSDELKTSKALKVPKTNGNGRKRKIVDSEDDTDMAYDHPRDNKTAITKSAKKGEMEDERPEEEGLPIRSPKIPRVARSAETRPKKTPKSLKAVEASESAAGKTDVVAEKSARDQDTEADEDTTPFKKAKSCGIEDTELKSDTDKAEEAAEATKKAAEASARFRARLFEGVPADPVTGMQVITI